MVVVLFSGNRTRLKKIVTRLDFLENIISILSLYSKCTPLFSFYLKSYPLHQLYRKEREISYHFFFKYIDIFFLFSCTLVCLAVYMKSSISHAATNMGVHQSLIISNIFSQIDTLIYLVGTNVHSILRQYLDICT